MEKDIVVIMKMFWIFFFSGRFKKFKRKKILDKQSIVYEDDVVFLDLGSNVFIL